jgi:hypothetical protein
MKSPACQCANNPDDPAIIWHRHAWRCYRCARRVYEPNLSIRRGFAQQSYAEWEAARARTERANDLCRQMVIGQIANRLTKCERRA